MGAGASRTAQHDDFFKVCVSKADDKVTVEALNVKEMDGFGGRHSIGSATWKGKTLLFGGQDVLAEKTLNEVHLYHADKNEFEKIEYIKDGQVVPKPRNSHTMSQSGGKAYVYGGANEDGPLNDAFEVDLETHAFTRIQVKDINTCPFFEMHTAHVYKGNQLLLIGGRSHVLPCEQEDQAAVEKAMMTPFRDSIISLDLSSGEVSTFATLPSGLASHTSLLLEDKYLFIYGGTNGLKIFDAVIRFDLDTKEMSLMAKEPASQKGSAFFKDGRLATVSAYSHDGEDPVWLLFGGGSATEDYSDFLVLRKSHLMNEANFSTITEIM